MMIDSAKCGHYAEDEWTPGPGDNWVGKRELVRVFLSGKVMIYDFGSMRWVVLPDCMDMLDITVSGYLRLNT